jgi:shikimate kinase
MNLRLKKTPGIYVTGFTASGKTTIGRLLAHRLGWSFFDLDDEIEAAEKASVAELFDTRGEAEFRRIEAQILRQHVSGIERGRPAVLALGAETFAGQGNRDLVLGNGIAIWLDCPLEIIERRVKLASHWAAARAAEKFTALHQASREDNAKADIHIAIESDDPAAAVDAIQNHALLR